MKTTTPQSRVLAATVFLLVVGLCAASSPAQSDEQKNQPAQSVETRKVEIGRNVILEIKGESRRVLVNGTICLRQGALEMLMCRRQTKEHESIVTTDSDARYIHKALLLTKATAGKPCQYLETGVKPATGTTIKISIQYERKGKAVTVRANEWVRNMKTRKELKEDWVFAGSRFAKNPFDPKKPDIYLANEGDVVCISNFEDAMLDLPIASPKDNDDLSFEANTDKIPPLETKVVVILEPVLEKKAKK